VPIDQLPKLMQQLAGQATKAEKLDAYYEGRQPLAFLSPQVQNQVGKRLWSLVINWPRLLIDSIEDRLDVEGFRLSSGDPDESIWRDIWQANDCDELSQLCHLDALALRRSFVSVWMDGDLPKIAVESERQMTCRYKPGTSDIAVAYKQFVDGDTARALLYLPDRIEKFAQAAPPEGSAFIGTSWVSDGTLKNPLGEPPVVAFANRPRLTCPEGVSELVDVIPVADAINKLATDMMVAAEYTATPRRYATGLELPNASGDQLEIERARIKKYWSDADADRVWVAGAGVTFGQFEAATLTNFVSAIEMFERALAAMGSLPPHYMGIATANPASADAIRSAEASLVKKARRKQRFFGGSWERVIRMALLARDAELPKGAMSMETIWRDPETPTIAQKADAAVKLYAEGIVDLRQTLEDLGYTPQQIDAQEARRATQVASAATEGVRAQLALAQQLQDTQGLTQPAALAAVGLLQAAGLQAGQPPAIASTSQP
jgi:hypothetical protein